MVKRGDGGRREYGLKAMHLFFSLRSVDTVAVMVAIAHTLARVHALFEA